MKIKNLMPFSGEECCPVTHVRPFVGYGAKAISSSSFVPNWRCWHFWFFEWEPRSFLFICRIRHKPRSYFAEAVAVLGAETKIIDAPGISLYHDHEFQLKRLIEDVDYSVLRKAIGIAIPNTTFIWKN